MSLARKNWNPQSHNNYNGYYPTVPNVTCLKEGIQFGQELYIIWWPWDNYKYEANIWPPQSVPGAVEFILSYYHSMTELGLELTHLLAIRLDKEENYFDELFLHKPLSTLRLMHNTVRHGPINNTWGC